MPPLNPRLRVSRRPATVLLVGALLGALLVSAFALVRPCVAPSESFDAAAWRTSRDALVCSERDDMVDDLRDNHLRRGMTRSDVVTLLGDGEEAATAAAEPDDLAYKLSCYIDCSWLVVSFNDADKVATADVWND